MTHDIGVISMGVSSADLISQIHEEVFLGAPEQSWTKSEFESMFAISGTECFIIKNNDKPLGFSLVRSVADEAEIITFCILPNHTKNGYATLLLEWIVKELQKRALNRLFLEVRENNIAAIKLYKKCLFDIIGRRKGYYHNHQGEKIDAIVMQRCLVNNE
ncbi:ribosomal protein S18-alanine N-acetyltransferase [Pseudemcibacter aquimaris]|uniref:ribosomal protein S18-alanine N-acetyltransferase n=1 Tax=Pseudemcibacter aquimaris TaxID=2857064 RepID=UPI0020139BCC|nr:ribosomal protein S18-alanine N-acetyltransferase [Pseudemcibacter aquimaris]MCC3862354.1 ribosomal protein S18-alanine N-acetyltransferase [Pseudemcibacter aquimaris]WDU59215.1 ribosomal protein S18-alanine N-acetyltransferase [Pseudemcibacter aquimaris]